MENKLTLEQIQNFEGKYPKQLWYLFLVEMWERFCFYGMRGVLTIFMADQLLGLSLSDKEANLKIDFVKKYGAKEWEAVLKIKLDIENIERKANEDFQHDLKDIRRVQLMCFALAAIIAYYLTWGYK